MALKADIIPIRDHFRVVVGRKNSIWGDSLLSAGMEHSSCGDSKRDPAHRTKQTIRENDRSPASAIVKGVNRTLAGRLVELGFRQGGPAGYGWSFCALQLDRLLFVRLYRLWNGVLDSIAIV